MDSKQIQQIRQQVMIPKQLTEAAQRIVTAGRKVLFSKETRKMVMDELTRKAPAEERVGKGVSDLMVLLFMQSNKSMPPQLIMPCAILLACDVIEFMMEAGEQVDVGGAIERVTIETSSRFGVKPENLKELMGQVQKNPQQYMGMPQKPQGRAPQPPGMIGG